MYEPEPVNLSIVFVPDVVTFGEPVVVVEYELVGTLIITTPEPPEPPVAGPAWPPPPAPPPKLALPLLPLPPAGP